MKEQFIKLTVYLFNAPDDMALDQQQIEDMLTAFAIKIGAGFANHETIHGDHFAQYCDLCNRRNLTSRKAEQAFSEVFEQVPDPREYTEFIPLENKEI